MKEKKKLSLPIQIFIGMAAGIVAGLICAFAGALFAPATAALKGLDFGLIPTMLWGFMAGMAAYPGVVLPQAAQPEDEPEG